MATRRPETIYRFDSVCGRCCYVGRTEILSKRIQEHRNGVGSQAIFRHCRECSDCDLVRQSESKWRKCFTKIDSATGSQAVYLEQKYINEACEQYIRDQRKPFPVNQIAEGGNAIELLAAKTIFDVHEKFAAEKSHSRKLQANLKTTKLERDNARQERDKFRKERDTARKQRASTVQERDKLRKKDDALTSQLFEAQGRYRALEDHLASVERELREQERTRIDPLQSSLESVGQKLDGREKLVKQLERKARGDARERERLERKLDDAVARHRGELRQRNLFIGILVIIATVAASVSFIVIENPDLLEQGRELLSFLTPDDSAPATMPISSHTITVTPRPTITPSATHTPRPTVTPRPTSTSAPTPTPFSTATPAPTRAPIPSPTPHLRSAIVDGGRARACPRRDNEECPSRVRLASGDQVTVLGEIQGELHEGSTLWYRIALPDRPDDAFVHSSLLGSPTPLPPDG